MMSREKALVNLVERHDLQVTHRYGEWMCQGSTFIFTGPTLQSVVMRWLSNYREVNHNERTEFHEGVKT